MYTRIFYTMLLFRIIIKMIKLNQIIQEIDKEKKKAMYKDDETLSRDFAYMKMYEKANTGEVKLTGVKALATQIKNNKLRYSGFPQWVLQSWIDPTRYPAIPLKNNRYLDTQSIVNSDSDIEGDNVVYAGPVVDSFRKPEFGIKAISLTTAKEIDSKKISQLFLFKKTAIQAKSMLEQMGEGDMQQQFPQTPTGGTTPEAIDPMGGSGGIDLNNPNTPIGGDMGDGGIGGGMDTPSTGTSGITSPTSSGTSSNDTEFDSKAK